MTLDDLLPLVLPSVSACPEILATQHLRLALRRFCNDSLAWRSTLEPITADGTSATYDLIPDDDTEIVKLIAVALDDCTEFEIVDPIRGKSLSRYWRNGDYVYTPDRRSMVLNYAPLAGQVLTVEVALQPSLSAIDFPDQLYSDYAETIAAGAIGSLLTLPKKDWSDPNLAAVFKAQFKSETTTAGLAVELGGGSSRPRVKANFF